MSYETRLQQWICKPLMFPWFNHRKAVTSQPAELVLLVEQWFSNTVLRAACSSQASFERLLPVFQQHL